VTRKIISEMTYNVSSGTLNPAIPYHTNCFAAILPMNEHGYKQTNKVTNTGEQTQ